MTVVNGQSGLAGWLVGLAFWSSLPIGSLGLVLMMRIIPGTWRRQLVGPAETALFLLPLAGLAVLPVLIGVGSLYAWSMADPASAFRAFYLNPFSFICRTVLFFVVLSAIALLLLRPRPAPILPSAGLIVFVLFDALIAVDWLMSLDAHFHSSGFGLYVLSIQMTIALAILTIARLVSRSEVDKPGILGSLLLTALLLWAYLSFMQYFIIWSDNLSEMVIWYQRRNAGYWSLVEYAIGALHLGPTFLLLFAPFREKVRCLIALAATVLLGKILEVAWLVLPGAASNLLIASIGAILTLIGLGLLSAAAWVVASKRRSPMQGASADRKEATA